MAEQKITGGCYCGAIRYAVLGEELLRVNCHCGNCRRAVGAQSVAFVIFPKTNFAWTRGNPVRFRTDTGAWRSFCSRCGSSLSYEADDRADQIDLTTGTVDDPAAFAPARDAFADEKLPWVPLVEKET